MKRHEPDKAPSVAAAAADIGNSASSPNGYRARTSILIFLGSLIVAGITVAGPGLSWDEPAYRHSQVTLQNWFRELSSARSWGEFTGLFSKDAIDEYFEYNRVGHNFHPPLAGYLNLATWSATAWLIDDVSARRLASTIEFALVVTILGHFVGTRYGTTAGVFAALSLLTMPRIMGHAHLIDTDMPMLLFWAATATAFYRGLESRPWQAAFAVCWGLLFLVKFSGMVITIPLAIWFLALLIRQPIATMRRWLVWTLIIVVPLIPLAVVLRYGVTPPEGVGAAAAIIRAMVRVGIEHRTVLGLLFLWPAGALLAFYRSKLRNERCWPAGLEIFWMALAISPLVVIALNPTWQHDTVLSLANYFDLNFRREGHLPDIGIYYLGKRYLYSLPWHNAWVLMAVTIPFGAFAFGLLGISVALARWRRDSLPVYFVLQMATMPVIRMLPVPAHDGVRLFLPTFFYWSALAGIGAAWLVGRIGFNRTNRAAALAWMAAFGVGPVWAGIEWMRLHPYELSYYNIGLRRAVDLGFEQTYWYDAVTPRVLAKLNESLPQNVSVGLPDELINTETFGDLQALGRLRSDIRLSIKDTSGFPWIWLLTHPSKATPFTRLLYAVRPWFENGVQGVRLFSVVDDRGAAVAWGLYSMTVVRDQVSRHDARRGPVPLALDDFVFDSPPDAIRAASKLLALPDEEFAAARASAAPDVARLLERWAPGGQRLANLERLRAVAPEALARAGEILASRPADVRKVIETPGYLLPERFGGYFEVDGAK